jgi:glyceraldehyde-3-phosphate dehydrogenase (NAD(P))
VWADSIAVRDNDLYCFQAIHQQSDVVPENVDAIRAITGTATAAESVATTDETLGMGLGAFLAPSARTAQSTAAGVVGDD